MLKEYKEMSVIYKYFGNNEKSNILTAPTHERIDSLLTQSVDANFWSFQHPSFVKWKTNQSPLPTNYTLLDENLEQNQIPLWLDLDIVLAQNIYSQYQILTPIARQRQISTIRYEHTQPTGWSQAKIQGLRNLTCDQNIFITQYSQKMWGFDNSNSRVIEHGIDTELFKPDELKFRQPRILSVVNDWINRGQILGFDLFREVVQGLPVHVLGDTAGLSRPASSVEELIDTYNSSLIYLNTSIMSPIPCSLLEAASIGCAIVSTSTCEIPNFFEHENTAFLSNDSKELRKYCEHLLANPKEAMEMGRRAREMVKKRCDKERFLKEWNDIFNKAIQITRSM